jgi:hypothetical protein
MDEDKSKAAGEAAQIARVALIVAAIALALSILGLFLPIG